MNPIVLVAIVNKSNLPGLEEKLPDIVHALALQLVDHVQPVWGRVIPAIEYIPSTGEPSRFASQLVIFDDADQAGALGYHDETPDGVPYGRVFVKPIIESGGDIDTSANSVSVTLSHELLEMVGDASVNLWADGGDGYGYALELCDAVESDAYAIDGVMVSNFVYPSFFDPQAEPGAKLDHLGKLDRPFGMTSGGYQIRRTENGRITNVWGEHYPAWKKALKSRHGARTHRRNAKKPAA